MTGRPALTGVTVILAFGLFSTSCHTVTQESRKPPFAVSSVFDGDWEGERFDVTGSPICKPTKVSGSVTNGYARLRLHYNNTLLTGWIAQDGTLRLDHDSLQWNYTFVGKAEGNEINGDWLVGNAPCRATWYVKRR